jgi:hypothetical protein
MSQAFLSRGSGPTNTSDDPYHDYDDRPDHPGPVRYYVQESDIFTTPDQIKSALMTYGALA